MKKSIYLAYGSNMSLQQMYHRCPDAEPVGKGIIKGWRLMFKGSQSGNYATIEKEEGCTVPVVVWAISEKDEERLDRYEGWPHFYVKETVEFDYISDRPGRRVKGEGMVYIMPPDESTLGLPSQRYFDVLVEGYHRFGLDLKILYEALDYSK
ncbi:gamma-glutamylcyclotransferase family protein [Anaerovibrio sp. JC8]|uniref:gamma-glutamylcyclotransferase family protein n=1 Tax=Anaerovibrio sp. JC8 TaxID=1240085 RepID=UPI000A0F9421|nr:gamma-glutamylcyclotransferase family protein [Anaerovibrio sp. JC8]